MTKPQKSQARRKSPGLPSVRSVHKMAATGGVLAVGRETQSTLFAEPAEPIRETKTSRLVGPWELNKVHNADCLVGLSKLPSASLDVAITSPPYWGQRGYGTIGSEKDPREYVKNLISVLAETMRCLTPKGLLWLNVGDAFNTPINWREDDYGYSTLGADKNGLDKSNSAYTKVRGSRRAFIDKDVGWLKYGNQLALPYRIVIGMSDLGFLFRGEVIWEKSRPLPEGLCRRPHRRHEGIYIFANDERHAFKTKPPVGSVWKLLQTPNKTAHCSTFPIDLPLQCIIASDIPKDGIVFDPFMGSGTTGKAARQLGYSYLGFELDPENCKIASNYITSS